MTHPLLDERGDLLPVAGFLNLHAGLRRDAARFVDAAARVQRGELDDDGVAALQEHWRRYHAILDFHHDVEDHRLFPAARRAEPAIAGVLDDLASEHAALEELLPRVDAAAEAVGSGGAAEAVDAFRALQDLLEPHLAAEEEHVVPVVLRMLAGDGDVPGPPSGPDDQQDEGPVPWSFAHPWLTEHLDGEVLARMLDALTDDEQAQYPAWRAQYDADLARWVPEARTAERR